MGLSTRSKREAVYEWLHEAIKKGDFQPGSQLVIDEVARILSVSSIPVREALQQLEAEGFVNIKPYTGVTVSEIRPALILEVFLILEATEVIGGRLVCHSADDEYLQELEGLLREMDALQDDPEQWSAANIRFHQTICAAADTVLAGGILDRMLEHWDRLRRFYLRDVFASRIRKAQAGHWAIVEAIKARDPDAVEATVRRHNRAALADYVSYLQSKGLVGEAAVILAGEGHATA